MDSLQFSSLFQVESFEVDAGASSFQGWFINDQRSRHLCLAFLDLTTTLLHAAADDLNKCATASPSSSRLALLAPACLSLLRGEITLGQVSLRTDMVTALTLPSEPQTGPAPAPPLVITVFRDRWRVLVLCVLFRFKFQSNRIHKLQLLTCILMDRFFLIFFFFELPERTQGTFNMASWFPSAASQTARFRIALGRSRRIALSISFDSGLTLSLNDAMQRLGVASDALGAQLAPLVRTYCFFLFV